MLHKSLHVNVVADEAPAERARILALVQGLKLRAVADLPASVLFALVRLHPLSGLAGALRVLERLKHLSTVQVGSKAET